MGKKFIQSGNSSDPRIINIADVRKEIFQVIDNGKAEGILYKFSKS